MYAKILLFAMKLIILPLMPFGVGILRSKNRTASPTNIQKKIIYTNASNMLMYAWICPNILQNMQLPPFYQQKVNMVPCLSFQIKIYNIGNRCIKYSIEQFSSDLEQIKLNYYLIFLIIVCEKPVRVYFLYCSLLFLQVILMFPWEFFSDLKIYSFPYRLCLGCRLLQSRLLARFAHQFQGSSAYSIIKFQLPLNLLFQNGNIQQMLTQKMKQQISNLISFSAKLKFIYYQKLKMGGGPSRAQELLKLNKIDPNQWRKIRADGVNQYVVDDHGQQGEVNFVKLDPRRKKQEELEVYWYRRNPPAPLVKCFGAESINDNSSGVCGANNLMKVITQRIVKRWVDLPQLTFPQIAYAVTQALQGYKTLYKQAGYFDINPNMLGVNRTGDLLVWLNQNFGQNNPPQQKGVLYSTQHLGSLINPGSQGQMVKNVLRVIQQRCQQGKYPQDFRNLSNQIATENLGFDDAVSSIKNYIKLRNIETVNKIHPDPRKMYMSTSRGIKLTGTPKKQFDSSLPSFLPKNQTVYESSYVNNQLGGLSGSPLMTPKNMTISPNKQVNYSVGSGGNFSSGNYKATVLSSSPQVVQKVQKYQDKFKQLRQNPNINTTQSVLYSIKQKQPATTTVTTTTTRNDFLSGIPYVSPSTNNNLASFSPNTKVSFNSGTTTTVGVTPYAGTQTQTQTQNYTYGNVGQIKRADTFGVTPVTYTSSGSGAKVTPVTFTPAQLLKQTSTFRVDPYPNSNLTAANTVNTANTVTQKTVVTNFSYEPKPIDKNTQIQTSQVTKQF